MYRNLLCESSSACYPQQPAMSSLLALRPEGEYVPVLILVLLVNAAHQGSCRWQDLVDEDEDGLLG